MRAIQKLKEWSVAVSLEKDIPKKKLLLYFNKLDFNYNAKGIELASRIYFNKNTKDLTLSEAATFVAMFETQEEITLLEILIELNKRRNVVLEQMLKTNYIDQATFDKVAEELLQIIIQ
jgi:penicillin-binding protein 1A